MFHTTDNPHISLTINGVAIAQDSAGRYRITDLHKASGGENRHKPNLWIDNKQTQELIDSIRKSQCRNSCTDDTAPFEPVRRIKGGDYPGTYVHEDLVIDYAMWISADFKLRVIQAFKTHQLRLTDAADSFFSMRLSQENRLLKEQIALLKTAMNLQNHYLSRCGNVVEADVDRQIDAHPVSSTPPPPPPSTAVPQPMSSAEDPQVSIDPPWLAILKHWSQAVSRGEFTTFHRDRIEDQPVVLVRLNHILQYLGEQRDTANALLKYSIPAFKRELRAHGILLSDQPHERNIDGRRVSNLRALNLHVLKQWKAWDME